MKKHYISILQTLELLLTLINVSFFFICDMDYELGLIFTNNTKFIPLTVSLTILILYLLEFFQAKPFKRIIFFAIALISCLTMRDETFNIFNSTLCVLSAVYAIIMIITICIVSIRKTPPTNATIIPSTKKELPIGYFSKKDYFTFISLFLVTILTITLLIFFYKNIIGLIILSIILIGEIIGFFFYFRNSKLRILLKKINTDLSFEIFLTYINELENSKDVLNFETYNFLKLIKANYYFVYDVEEGLKIFESCIEPTYANYKNIYDVILIEYYINKDDVVNAKKAYEDNCTNKALSKLNYPYLFIALFSELDIPNIETIFSLNNKLKINDCNNLHTLMLYYYKRKNLLKAKEMAQKMLDMHSDFKNYNNLAKQILENGEKE